MACRARIERATVLLLRDVGRGLEGAQRLHEAVRVVAFVTADRHTSARQARDETRRGGAFAGAGRRHHAGVDHQSVAVLHQHFAEIGQLGLVSLGLLEQSAVGIGRRLVRQIRAPFPMEIDRWIAAIVWRVIGRSLPFETFLTCPRFQQRAVDGEMLGGQQATTACLLHDIFKEGPGDIALQQPIAVLGEGGRRPHRVVHRQPHKPPKQQVVLQLLHQHPLAAHGIQHLEQQCPQQMLGRNRRDGRSSRRSRRTGATGGAGLHPSSCGSSAADDPPAHAAPATGS